MNFTKMVKREFRFLVGRKWGDNSKLIVQIKRKLIWLMKNSNRISLRGLQNAR